ALEQMERLLRDQPHGKRKKIADEIEQFADELEKKYN
ncbi:hypothetical protein LCGC14_1912020, partial [marine sediment metagenome]